MIEATLRRLGDANRRSTSNLDAPLLRADWMHTVMMHYSITPQVLRPFIPFELDTFEGSAYVSFVAFRQENLRLARGGWVGALVTSPLATHEFLNLRTYVRVNGESGIFFISEWIPNRLAVLIGPRTYGLPYHQSTIKYRWSENGHVEGRVSARGGCLRFAGQLDHNRAFAPAEHGTIDHFLLERYVAFTARKRVFRKFHVRHDPWPQARLDIQIEDASLLLGAGDWARKARHVSSVCSKGVRNVWIAFPRRISA